MAADFLYRWIPPNREVCVGRRMLELSLDFSVNVSVTHRDEDKYDLQSNLKRNAVVVRVSNKYEAFVYYLFIGIRKNYKRFGITILTLLSNHLCHQLFYLDINLLIATIFKLFQTSRLITVNV